ncbi:MAG: hypothetical protein Q9191_003914 [Dirinaria sp. TL-2023a]
MADDKPPRERTFPYFSSLPYGIEDEAERQKNFQEILKHLYVAVEAGDLAPGALHWTRELRSWLGLKFRPSKEQRVILTKLYYELALAPGVDISTADRFASMFMVLTKRKHYMKPGKDLTLNWRPLLRQLKLFVLPSESGTSEVQSLKHNLKTLTKMCAFAQVYFDPADIPALLNEILPYFTTSLAENAFVVAGLLNLLFPTAAASAGDEKLAPQYYLPTFFHLWTLVNRSRAFDTAFVDLFSRLARESLTAEHVAYTEYGIFTKDQSSLIFTSILRLLDIPVGQVTSPYSAAVDGSVGAGIMVERDARKNPVAHSIARWVIMSLSPACLDKPDSILANLEGLIQAVETFFHPSNQGAWTKTLFQLVHYLADFFVMRWNRERSGEMEVPAGRGLTDELKRRFVLSIRDVIFMGIYAKSGTAMNLALSTLQSLAFLEPNLILPGALQRIYPSMQGLVEVHRTSSSLRSLQHLSGIMARTKGFRCHITTMLGLALPGIDANDLEKTLYTLQYIQSVCYNIPLHDLTKDSDNVSGNMIAMEWITSEVDRMEQEGANVKLEYDTKLDDKDEELILRSSTAGLAEFVSSFLGKIFTVLENLPDASRVRSGSPEENIVNTLPATFTPLLASLSPELYNLALNKVAEFAANHVIHQGRDGMAFICSALCKVNPEKALKRLVPVLIQSIRTEIDENGAASTRTTGTDVLPRDRGLVWSVSLLSMCVVHVGDAVLTHRDELLDIAVYMQQKCKGIPTVHISNYIHHLLLSLTGIYPVDYSLHENDVLERGISPLDWGRIPDPKSINIQWHVPSKGEVDFAVELFRNQGESALAHLAKLIDGTSSIKRDGVGKAWSDEISRNLVLLRLLLSGVAVLFDAKASSKQSEGFESELSSDVEMVEANGHNSEEITEENLDTSVEESEENEVKPTFKYPTGYLLDESSQLYDEVHDLRERIGKTLHKVHEFLVEKQEDDVACFGPLYTAYRSWFIDVGIERSAHVFDRVAKLLAVDIQPFKINGLRKHYPRPLLVRRASLYHLSRLRHNSAPRIKSDLDKQLLFDLAHSSMSTYTEVRRNAQNAGEAAFKAIIGSRPLVIPTILRAFEAGLKANNFPRIKGGFYTLIFGSLARTIGRDWRYTPRVVKCYVEATVVDRPSIQKLAAGATIQMMDFGRPTERMVILDKGVVQEIAPSEDVQLSIEKKKGKVAKKRANFVTKKAALCEELVDITRTSHWKQAQRIGTILLALGLRFDEIASDNLIDLIFKGAIDTHPGLRSLYQGSSTALFSVIEARAFADHKYENYISDKQHLPARIKVQTRRDDPKWTKDFLSSFAVPDAEYHVDHDHPGWLVWDETMTAFKPSPEADIEFDDHEKSVLSKIGKILDRKWFSKYCEYLKQEPRDTAADRFRLSSAVQLECVFAAMHHGFTTLTFSEVQEKIYDVFGDGSDKHQHRATAELLGALLSSTMDKPIELRTEIWDWAFPIVRGIFLDGLTPENQGYWLTFLRLVLQGRDPRRSWPMVDWLCSLRLDMTSNAAFKESSKVRMLQQCVIDIGWHFQLEKPIAEDFLAHLDHPYKGVREVIATTLSSIYRSRYHESYKDVETLMLAQREASSVGTRPYQPTEDFTETMRSVFDQLEKWRQERTPGQQTPSPYTLGSKTVLLWLDTTLTSLECIGLVPFFPDVFMGQLLQMIDIREDVELASLAYHVFKHLPNIPHGIGEDIPFIESLIKVGRTSTSWHQRLRSMVNMQAIYFRRLFLIAPEQQRSLFECVASMLEDAQLEVRFGASSTLSGMIRCSPLPLRTTVVADLEARFTKLLLDNPLPKKPKNNRMSAPSTGTSTPTPEHEALVLKRHAAVLGLGALVQAFPYSSPPPEWIPGVLTTLANKANADPGMVGKSVKSILSEFKKTRQDTWHVDLKAFSQEQAEDLDGVLWKSYFA